MSTPEDDRLWRFQRSSGLPRGYFGLPLPPFARRVRFAFVALLALAAAIAMGAVAGWCVGTVLRALFS